MSATFELSVAGRTVAMFNGCRVGAHVRSKGSFEPESLAAWIRVVKPRTAAIDVGAYTGVYSLFAQRCEAISIAIEPHWLNVLAYQRNARYNGFSSRIYQAAASDKRGSAMLRFNPDVQLTSGGTIEPNSTQTGTLSVSTMMLDDLMTLGRVSAVKIDVERHEMSVLKGAMELLEATKPAIILECLDSDLRPQLEKQLRNWNLTAVLDQRNLLFER
jgi:FkbM family methyltransferase